MSTTGPTAASSTVGVKRLYISNGADLPLHQSGPQLVEGPEGAPFEATTLPASDLQVYFLGGLIFFEIEN